MSLDVNISEPDEFNCVELHSAIENVAKLSNFEEFSYHVDYLHGNGYIANIFRVILTENGSEKRISFIVKTLINTARKELFSELHNREVNAYIKIIDTFRILQNDIEELNRIVLPKCIYSNIDKGNEILVFEDLLENGFKEIATDDISFPKVTDIFSELAKFHGLSYVLERNNSNHCNELAEDFNDLLYKNCFLDKSKLRNYFSDSFEMSLNVIDDLEVKKKLESIKPKLLALLQHFVSPKERSVFCHGDFWIKNILYKQMENKNTLCLLDFQTLRYTNPATDIVYFLYICTDSQFRSEHIDKLISIYYDSLKEFSYLFNIDVAKLYTEEELKQDIEENKVFGLLTALVEIRIFGNHSNEINEKSFSEIDFTKSNIDTDNLIKARINDVISECSKNGVLDKLFNVALRM